jgi:hypothetical protein
MITSTPAFASLYSCVWLVDQLSPRRLGQTCCSTGWPFCACVRGDCSKTGSEEPQDSSYSGAIILPPRTLGGEELCLIVTPYRHSGSPRTSDAASKRDTQVSFPGQTFSSACKLVRQTGRHASNLSERDFSAPGNVTIFTGRRTGNLQGRLIIRADKLATRTSWRAGDLIKANR